MRSSLNAANTWLTRKTSDIKRLLRKITSTWINNWDGERSQNNGNRALAMVVAESVELQSSLTVRRG
jgi:hypothetical protein